MLTAVERVLILKGADLLREVGPRHLLELAEVAREIEWSAGDTIYMEDDAADALYMMVEGRVRLSNGERTISEVGPAEAFGTWALVDDSARGQRAECIEDGLALAVHRDDFYDVAAGDLALLQEVVRALARRLRELVSEKPDEARVEGEGAEKPETLLLAEAAAEAAAESAGPVPQDAPPSSPGAELAAAAIGQPTPREAPEGTTEPAATSSETMSPEPTPAAPPRPA